MSAVSQEVDAAALEDVGGFEVEAVFEALGVSLKKLVCVADPLNTLFGSGVGYFADLQPDLGKIRLIHNVLLFIVVSEPRRIYDTGCGTVALYEVIYRVVGACDVIADGCTDAMVLVFMNGLFVIRGKVPGESSENVNADLLVITDMTNLLSWHLW